MTSRAHSAGERAHAAVKRFREVFAREPEFAVRAPGRVNLIGEHTDYNEGLVLPCAIDLDTAMWVALRSDRRIRVLSLELGEVAEFAFEFERTAQAGETSPAQALSGFPTNRPTPGVGTGLSIGPRTGSWIDYVAGPVFAFGARGRDVDTLGSLRGFDAVVGSDIPMGSGLSSSAALGLASAWAFALANHIELDPRELAELAWLGERDYVGIGCGVLDFYASALGNAQKALRIDCRDLAVQEIDFPAELEILIAHSGVHRSVAASAYGERVAECARALEQARAAGIAGPTATSLRALTGAALNELEAALDPIAFRRARHVMDENDRVDAFAAALAERRFGDAGEVLRSGMASLRTNYEVSIPELDLLCEAGDDADGCYGSRMTGAGWGGCSIHLIRAGSGPQVVAQLNAHFGKHFGRSPRIWKVQASRGAGSWLSGVSD